MKPVWGASNVDTIKIFEKRMKFIQWEKSHTLVVECELRIQTRHFHWISLHVTFKIQKKMVANVSSAVFTCWSNNFCLFVIALFQLKLFLNWHNYWHLQIDKSSGVLFIFLFYSISITSSHFNLLFFFQIYQKCFLFTSNS